MIRVFLVEDEVVMRTGIREQIKWEEHGFEFVGEASDGELAYPMIMKLRPDIVITDIKMPFMDGLELSSIIKNELPDTKIIILSGYDEFNYAKKAIEIGVTSYLLKPINSVKLLAEIDRVAGVINEERQQKELIRKYEEEISERMELEKGKLFDGIIQHTFSLSQILEKGKTLDIDFVATCYNVVLVQIMPKDKTKGNVLTYSENRVQASEEFNAYIKSNKSVICFNRETEGWILILKGGEVSDLELLEKDIFNKVLEMTTVYETVGYFAGVGKTVYRIGDISESYREAGKAFAGRFFMPVNQVVHYSEAIGLREKDAVELDLNTIKTARIDRGLMESFLSSATEGEVDDFIERCFEQIGEEQCESQILRQYIVADIYIFVAEFIEKLGKCADNIEENINDASWMANQVRSLENTKKYMKALLCKAILIRDHDASDLHGALIVNAKEYIKNNFQNNEISLNSVASNVNISPSYFSTIFRQKTNQTFTEYLTNLRLEKAKEMLMCTNMKASEIGYEVGYADSHYFSYIFKKTQGCTPKEYRNR